MRHASSRKEREASSLGEDTRIALVVGRTDVREWSRYHDESEWSLIISLMRPCRDGAATTVLFDHVPHVGAVHHATRQSRGRAMLREAPCSGTFHCRSGSMQRAVGKSFFDGTDFALFWTRFAPARCALFTSV